MNHKSALEAAAGGDVAALKTHTDLVAQNERGWTPLHFAARYGQKDAVKYLLEQKVPTNTLNSEGKTAGQVAAFWGHEDVARVLGGGDVERSGSANEQKQLFPVHNNHFAGSPLNSDQIRLGAKRSNNPLIVKDTKPPQVAWLSYNDIADVIENPYTKGDVLPHYNLHEEEPFVIFLGMNEGNEQASEAVPYFAVDVTPRGNLQAPYEQWLKSLFERSFEFGEMRPLAMAMDPPDAAILAQARAMIDWNMRNQYCPACGRRTVSADAGYKRTCPPQDVQDLQSNDPRPPCISSQGVHNFSYPRTDPVIIVAVLHPTEDKILLGRQKSWPKGMYSCLAGFIEAGESLEEAVRREVREESGVVVDGVKYHSSQPWPFPNSLMMGCLAEASTTDIKLEDKELEGKSLIHPHMSHNMRSL
ncbi:hypothetical protein BZG36_03707 [Bifiguratus adelaidae]|uniref:NAD-capped RNA hydrolase NUDT12 n=1 Tax=Bifiguratus adelaidae TaxID=1938954 RepID=A0A261XXG3_9FUNG|nr:hypothetical protein BZG36_03707 [Bifiguratus adelaidae]